MTRSSRHKSSKHSWREARDYSDSEKDLRVKERKGKEDSSSVRVSKDSEKRKLDSKENKDAFGSGNGSENGEEYSSSSKRRKDRASDECASDRWKGGEDERIESWRKSKGSSESSKSKRRDDTEEQRAKSSRKESREERKVKESKSERLAESEERSRSVNHKTDSITQDQLRSPESENHLESFVRRRRGSSGDGHKHEVDIGKINDRRRDNVPNDGRLEDEKYKDERYRDKYREDVDRENRHHDDKQRDYRSGKDHTNNRSDDKHLKDEKDAAETRQKKSKLQESDRDRDRQYDHDHDYIHERDFDIDRDRGRDRDRDHDHDRGRDHNRDHDHDHNHGHDGDPEWDRERNRELELERDLHRRDRDRHHDRERERERDPELDRNSDRDRELERDHERDVDNDGSCLDDHSFKCKDSWGKKRFIDECDDCTDAKSGGSKVHYSDMENKFLSGNRVESDADRGRFQSRDSRQAYVDSTVSSNRHRTSPGTNSHGGLDEYRHIKQEDSKYRDFVAEQRPKTISTKDVGGFSGALERFSKYSSTERSIIMEDGHLGEIIIEKSSSSKASPMGLVERSPSSTALQRRYMNRNGTRRSLDIEETGRRISISPRESSATEDRLSRELPLEKPLMDESAQMDLIYYNRTNHNQSNSSPSLHPSFAFRAGVGSPSFMGSLEEDGRVNISGHYRRSGDPSMGRGQGNAWRGTPNWSSPVPNGFIHFQHGPPHGGYPAMMSQIPSPSMFAVRPPMEMNHSGIPYHVYDADRFGSHLRPHGWQNMMEGSGPHLHGWDGNNNGFRDDTHMFGGADWDQNRHPMNGRGWEINSADMWNGENDDANMDLHSNSQKEDHSMQARLDDDLTGLECPQAQHENNHGAQDKSIETRSISSAKESFQISPKTADNEMPDPPKVSCADNLARGCCAYLSKLDISIELAGPDLYSECMSFLGLDQTATVDKDTAIIVNLRDGGRAVSKSSKTLQSHLLFPVADDSVFQRAMDNYKKHRVQMSGLRNGEALDNILTTNWEKVEQGPLCIVEKTEELILASDTNMPDVPILTSDPDKPEAVSRADVQETVEELVSTPCLVAQDHNQTPEPNLKEADQDSTPKSSEETVLAFNCDKVDEMTTDKVTSADAEIDHSPSPNNATQAATILPADGDNWDDIRKTKGNNSVYPAEEMQAVADATTGPLFFSEGSPKVSGELMLNESESVILKSRIHHSPENTH